MALKIKYLDASFLNRVARDGLVSLIRFAFPGVLLEPTALGDHNKDDALIIAEEYLLISNNKINDYHNNIILVTECFVENNFTHRITRNICNVTLFGIMAHVLAFYLHLVLNSRIIGKLSKWDILLLPAMPFFFLIYLYARIFRINSEIKSLVEQEYMFSGLQFKFESVLSDIAGIVFSHPSIQTSFEKFYPNSKISSLSPLPVFPVDFQFKLSGNNLHIMKWYGYRNRWRENRAKSVIDFIQKKLPSVRNEFAIKYDFSSIDSDDIFHLVMRQSEAWPLSSPIKIYDLIMAGKVPVLEFDFHDHPICDLALKLSDLVHFFELVDSPENLIELLENNLQIAIAAYNKIALDLNASRANEFENSLIHSKH